MDKRFQLQFTNKVDQELLRDAIAQWGISKRALTAIKFDGGAILVNGEERNVRHRSAEGDDVTIIFPVEEASEGLIPVQGELAVVYEDEAVLLVDKPAFMSSIPSREHPNNTLANLVYGYFEQQQHASTVHIVTRLDRDTSGLMLIAKHRHIHHLMSEQQKRDKFTANMKQLQKASLYKISNPSSLRLDGKIRALLNVKSGQTGNSHIRM